ncbi:integrase core domain-containing protein [Burkholderia stagnalis]|uniref:integrase core domain-containing protein n=1 Tax=Burkholderia stagnalis TaxID=1503054 RepID=UPI000F575F0C|nr:integrase core domain-containing protein [Burkholderia stagnalis]RQQ19970.1 hypothetical protein DF163_34285 [Burkholderia stagnalis]RQQ21979.1 hypothetical protein DF149_33780 [Burkholderia stagnalis]RQQ40630.1 hypothetical protein DF162_33930 [Burkholderia stagnalis]RQX85839.1 hypothetical protein DF119_34790 [Burkholderia stagnalis]RQY01708.1 hypothetical protein DF118_34040 [Burkholderia stagnalis]
MGAPAGSIDLAGRLTTRLQRPAAPRVDDARAKISAWRTHQNESRPHSALDWATPTEFARRYSLQVTSAILPGTGAAALAA